MTCTRNESYGCDAFTPEPKRLARAEILQQRCGGGQASAIKLGVRVYSMRPLRSLVIRVLEELPCLRPPPPYVLACDPHSQFSKDL